MDSHSISAILQSDDQVVKLFLGVFPSDKLPRICPRPCALVVNTDPEGQPGSHWVAIHIDVDGQGEFFDSYDIGVYSQFVKFMNVTCEDWINARKRLQGTLSSTCGQYCIYYLFLRCNGFTLPRILSTFDNDGAHNDAFVTDFVNDYFDANTQTYDVKYLCNQICTTFDISSLS